MPAESANEGSGIASSVLPPKFGARYALPVSGESFTIPFHGDALSARFQPALGDLLQEVDVGLDGVERLGAAGRAVSGHQRGRAEFADHRQAVQGAAR